MDQWAEVTFEINPELSDGHDFHTPVITEFEERVTREMRPSVCHLHEIDYLWVTFAVNLVPEAVDRDKIQRIVRAALPDRAIELVSVEAPGRGVVKRLGDRFRTGFIGRK